MSDKSPTKREQSEETKRLLARTPVIRAACELDLLVFLHRHPRTFLTAEQLAAFVGYNMKKVAKAIEAFTEAGILERVAQMSTHAARMYVLILDGSQGGDGLRAILQLASTREGRRHLHEVLGPEPSPPSPGGIVKGRRWLSVTA